jgi:hypothetical protein
MKGSIPSGSGPNPGRLEVGWFLPSGVRLPLLHILDHLLFHLGRCGLGDVRGYVPAIALGIDQPSTAIAQKHVRDGPLGFRAEVYRLGCDFIYVLDNQVQRCRRGAEVLCTVV